MMRDAVQQGCRHLGVAKYLHPLAEGQIGGDDQGRLLVELADQVKQQGATRWRKRQIAQFIDNDGVHQAQLLGQVADLAEQFVPLQQVHQVNSIEEAHALGLMDGRHANGRGQMRFPCADAADQNQVVRRFHKCRRSQLFQQCLRERRLVPVDAEQVAVDGEAGQFAASSSYSAGVQHLR